MKAVAVAFLAATLAGPVSAQTREETMTRVAETLEAISETMPSGQSEYLALQRTGMLEDRISDAVKMVNDLEDYLTDNPYVQVDGFSVVVPFGIAVNFNFPSEG